MYLLVTRDGSVTSTSVREPADLQRLHVECHGVSDAAVAAALTASGFGVLEGDHAWLDVAALRRAGLDSADWYAEFDAMIRYASEHGWTDEAATRVRAHVQRHRRYV